MKGVGDPPPPYCSVAQVTDEMRLPTQDLLGEKRLANLSVEKCPRSLLLKLLLRTICAGVYSVHANLINSLKAKVTENRYYL